MDFANYIANPLVELMFGSLPSIDEVILEVIEWKTESLLNIISNNLIAVFGHPIIIEENIDGSVNTYSVYNYTSPTGDIMLVESDFRSILINSSMGHISRYPLLDSANNWSTELFGEEDMYSLPSDFDDRNEYVSVMKDLYNFNYYMNLISELLSSIMASPELVFSMADNVSIDYLYSQYHLVQLIKTLNIGQEIDYFIDGEIINGSDLSFSLYMDIIYNLINSNKSKERYIGISLLTRYTKAKATLPDTLRYGVLNNPGHDFGNIKSVLGGGSSDSVLDYGTRFNITGGIIDPFIFMSSTVGSPNIDTRNGGLYSKTDQVLESYYGVEHNNVYFPVKLTEYFRDLNTEYEIIHQLLGSGTSSSNILIGMNVETSLPETFVRNMNLITSSSYGYYSLVMNQLYIDYYLDKFGLTG